MIDTSLASLPLGLDPSSMFLARIVRVLSLCEPQEHGDDATPILTRHGS